MIKKVQVRTLPVSAPPVPASGGIVKMPAGDLYQMINGEAFRFLAFIEFQPDATRPRGNHYHEAKQETLYIVAGRIRAVYFDLDSGDRDEVELSPGDVVTVEPRCAHVYYPLDYSLAIEVAPNAVDISDTKRYVVPDESPSGR
jgi:hypothetical protein